MLGIYCRTSKSRAEKYTIDTQRENGIKCAKKIGLSYRVYLDDGISGTLDESVRSGLSDLFKDMKSGELTAVYVIDQSRIERDTQTWYFFVSLCLNKKIAYYQDGSQMDLDNPTNRMYAQLMSVVNSYYAEITSRKVRDANARKAKEGKTHGLKPYGYQRDEHNRYVICEEEAKHVKRMFELSLNGMGAYSIANILNDEGVPTKFSKNFKGQIKRKDTYTNKVTYFNKSDVKWRGNVISDILKNPIYKGIRIWKKHEDVVDFIDGKISKSKRIVEEIKTDQHVPPIIDSELWDRVQKNLAVNKKNVGPKEQYHYLLNGLIYCEKCGKNYWGKKRLKGNDNAYKCLAKRYPNAKCDNRGINLPRLETFVINYLQKKPASAKLLKDLPEKVDLKDQFIKQLNQKEDELKKVTSVIKKLSNRLDNSLQIDEVLDKIESLQRKRQAISDDINVLKAKLSEEYLNNPNPVILQKNRKKIKELPKVNSEFDEIKKIVFQLVDWISILYVKEQKPAYFIVNIKLKGNHYYDSYKVSFDISEWQQIGLYIPKSTDEFKKGKMAKMNDVDLINILINSTNFLKPNEKPTNYLFKSYFKLYKDELYNFD